MKLICSFCQKDLGDKEPFDDHRISHGMCKDCFEAFDNEYECQEIDSFLEDFTLPVIVVNDDKRIIGCNTQARNQFGISKQDAFGLYPGEMINCKYVQENKGCGKSSHCLSCAIRRTITSVISTGDSKLDVDAVLSQDDKNLELVISAERLSSYVKVTIEHIAQTA